MATGSQNEIVTGASNLRTASTIAHLMAGAIKHYTLYPEDHSIAKQHFKKIFETFNSFLKTHKILHFDVGKNALMYDDEVVYQGTNEENDLAFLLGRDGVEWLEFSRDLELWEIQTLMRVINNNRRLDLTDDDNIATALWEQDFPHIEYKTIDLMAMDIPLIDLSGFRVANGQDTAEEAGQPQANRDAEWQDYYTYDTDEDDFDLEEEEAEAAALAITAPGSQLWNLSESEQLQLETMVRTEENLVDTEAIIEVLCILLIFQNSDQESSDILAFLQDRFLFCLQERQFQHALKIIRTLHNIISTEKGRFELLKPKIAELLRAVCRPESLRDLEKFFAQYDEEVDKAELPHLWNLLQLLPPEIIGTLAGISQSIDIQHFGPPFLALFKHFTQQAPPYVAEAATSINNKICLHLFSFIQQIPIHDAVPILNSLAQHPSQPVRNKAFELLDSRHMVELEQLFPLISDPNPAIQQKIVELAGSKRDPAIERLLLDYLPQLQGSDVDPGHVLACYHALGRAGSKKSIAFLRETLLQGVKLGALLPFGADPHKEGAAQALLELRIPEAKQVVKGGAANMRPDIRSACRKALETHYG